MSVTIGIKVSKEFRDLLLKYARQENRTLSNFIKHCIATYLKDKYSENLSLYDD